jgi:Flp pilus assembly CpaF family ATPase
LHDEAIGRPDVSANPEDYRPDLSIVPATGALNDFDPRVLEAVEKRRKIDANKTYDEKMERDRFYALLGPLKQFLDDDYTQNIEVNADGNVFVQRFGVAQPVDANGRALAVPVASMPKRKRVALIEYLAGLQYGRAMDTLHSELGIDLPLYGARVHCLAEPIADWPLVIRVHAKHAFPLWSYVEHDRMSQHQYDYLVQAIDAEVNIGIGGAVNSGKTQLLNSILAKKAELHPGKRGVIVQDRMEVKADGFINRLEILACVEQAYNGGNGSITRYEYGFAHALRTAMRLNQEFLVWGEVRDSASAIGLTMAVNTGTAGLVFTIHCKTARHLLSRIEQLFIEEGKTPIPDRIVDTVGLSIHMQLDAGTRFRRVSGMVRVHGIDSNNKYIFEDVAA